MSLFSFSEHPMFVACLGPQQTLKYVTVSLIFILYISKMRICTKVYASILSLIFLKYCIYIIIKDKYFLIYKKRGLPEYLE